MQVFYPSFPPFLKFLPWKPQIYVSYCSKKKPNQTNKTTKTKNKNKKNQFHKPNILSSNLKKKKKKKSLRQDWHVINNATNWYWCLSEYNMLIIKKSLRPILVCKRFELEWRDISSRFRSKYSNLNLFTILLVFSPLSFSFIFFIWRILKVCVSTYNKEKPSTAKLMFVKLVKE